MFLGGASLAYWVMPRGLEILLGFTPENIENIISVDRYLSFFLRMMLVFGLGFMLPLLVVGLNFAGVLSAQRCGRGGGGSCWASWCSRPWPPPPATRSTWRSWPCRCCCSCCWPGWSAGSTTAAGPGAAAAEPQWDDDETSPLDA